MGVINKTTEKINKLLDKIEDAPDKIENGKTPVFVAGTTTTLDPGMSATAEVVLVVEQARLGKFCDKANIYGERGRCFAGRNKDTNEDKRPYERQRFPYFLGIQDYQR